MGTRQRTKGLTHRDLLDLFPEEDHIRRELIDGELFVTPAASWRHQDVVRHLLVALHVYCREHGGKVLPSPIDVKLSETNVLQPDLLVLRPDHLDRLGDDYFVPGPPDLVIEVSSPSTRKHDLVRKRDVYERFGVPEFWFVDRDARRIEVYRLVGERFGRPELFGEGDVLEATVLPGLRVAVSEIP
jgi:Uma2 family endonuclease